VPDLIGLVVSGAALAVIEFQPRGHDGWRSQPRLPTMRAEQFLLLLETLRSRAHSDGSPRVVSTAPHVPVKLPDSK